jgi:hypothetical protein
MQYLSYLWSSDEADRAAVRNEDWEDWVEVDTSLMPSKVLSAKTCAPLVIVDNYSPRCIDKTTKSNLEEDLPSEQIQPTLSSPSIDEFDPSSPPSLPTSIDSPNDEASSAPPSISSPSATTTVPKDKKNRAAKKKGGRGVDRRRNEDKAHLPIHNETNNEIPQSGGAGPNPWHNPSDMNRFKQKLKVLSSPGQV